MRLLAAVLVSAVAFGQGFWERRAPFPIQATEVSSAALNGKIYTICGIVSTGRPARLYAYDPARDAWTDIAPMPIEGGADHCNFAAANGRLYLLGAIRIGGSFVDGNTYEYDPATNRWSTVGRMSTPRGASGVAVIGSRIYVAGGLAGGQSVNTFEVFDTAARSWSSLPNMPTARDHLTAQAVNGRFYAIAGRAGGEFNIVEEFNPEGSTWRGRAPIPTARGGLGSGVINDRIVVFGGEGDSGTPQNTFRQNEEYDPAVNTWRSLAPMLTPRHGMYGASVDGRIFVPGGGPIAGATYSDANEVFYLPPAEPPRVVSLLNAASFTAAVAPGALVSLFGEGLSLGEAVAINLPLASRLNAVEVRVNGSSAQLIYAGPKQINMVLPAALMPGSAELVVNNAGSAAASFRVNVQESAPAIFSLDQSGAAQGAILIAGTGLIARATRDAFSRAARRGEVVEIYATGLGVNFAAPAVNIGGANATVLFAGVSEQFPGLNQINARVPEMSATGTATPVVIQVGSARSNTVTMAVVE